MTSKVTCTAQYLNKAFKNLVSPPRLNGEKKGVYATRSPFRPNPLGLSVVKLEKITRSVIDQYQIDLMTKNIYTKLFDIYTNFEIPVYVCVLKVVFLL